MSESLNGRTTDVRSIDINLCSGAGGLAIGLVRTGFTPTEFYDLDRDACNTLRQNLERAHFDLRGSVNEADLAQIEWIASAGDVRLLAAGTPCQPFSMGGARRGHADSRNLFPVVLDAVRVLRPRAGPYRERARTRQGDAQTVFRVSSKAAPLSELRAQGLRGLGRSRWKAKATLLGPHGKAHLQGEVESVQCG